MTKLIVVLILVAAVIGWAISTRDAVGDKVDTYLEEVESAG